MEAIAPGDLTSGHQVVDDLGLALDHQFSASQGVQIDTHLASVEGLFEATVDPSVGVHALTHAGLAQQLYHAFFKNPARIRPST